MFVSNPVNMPGTAWALCKENVVRALTGRKVRPFEELLNKFDAESAVAPLCDKLESAKAPGGGRRYMLPNSAGMLFFILGYLEVYPAMDGCLAFFSA